MAAPIGALRAEMSAGHAQFERDMRRAKDAVRNNATGMKAAMLTVRDSFNGAVKSLFSLRSAVLLAAGVAGFAALLKKTIAVADQMTKLAQSVGVPVETLTSLSHAANLSGMTIESLSKGLKQISKNAMDAAAGIGEAKDAFRALGVSTKDSNGNLKSSQDLIYEIADKFREMEDGAGKTALAMRIFGRAGADLIPMLNQGSAGIKDMQDEAKALGLVIDAEVGKAAERFDDNLTRLEGASKGFANQVMKEFLPTLENLTDKMVKSAKETDGLGTSAKTAATGLRLLFSAGAIISGVFKTIGEYIGGAAAALVSLATGDFRQAMTIMSDTGWDLVDNVRGTVDNIKIIWDDTANDIEARAPETGKKIAAPIIETTKQIKSEISSQKALLADWDILNDYAKKTGQILSEIKTPVEKFNETMQELRILLKLGYIDFETFQQAARKAAQEWKGSGDEIDDQFGELRQAIDGWGKDAAGTFADFAMSGKASFRDLIDSIIRDLIKMSAYKAIFKPLFTGIEGLVPSLVSIGMHGGGTVGRDASFVRPVPADLFSHAPRLHSGLMPDEFPAILQKGEAVIPKDAVGGGAGDTNVFIYAVDAKSFEDMCRRNPGAINSQVLQSLRDNKTRSEIKSLLR